MAVSGKDKVNVKLVHERNVKQTKQSVFAFAMGQPSAEKVMVHNGDAPLYTAVF